MKPTLTKKFDKEIVQLLKDNFNNMNMLSVFESAGDGATYGLDINDSPNLIKHLAANGLDEKLFDKAWQPLYLKYKKAFFTAFKKQIYEVHQELVDNEKYNLLEKEVVELELQRCKAKQALIKKLKLSAEDKKVLGIS